MKYFFLYILLSFLFVQLLSAQSGSDSSVVEKPAITDTVKKAVKVIKPRAPVAKLVKDSVKNDSVKKDSVVILKPVQDKVLMDTAGMSRYNAILRQNRYFNFFGKPIAPFMEVRKYEHKEDAFYLLVGILLFFAMVRAVFFKYIQNLFTLLFRASLKQKQLREQLSQTPLPSLLLNIFFVLVTGTYSAFILRYYNKFEKVNFFLLVLYSCAVISMVYIVKFMVLKFSGWVFNLRAAADTYIFIIFLVNKLTAVFLLPLIFLIAFQSAEAPVWITLSYILLICSLLYRYLASYGPIRREIKVKQIHFFLYLCTSEIAPLLLIYKVLLNFFEKTV